ncbi:MAG TPA: carotenoid biosynthesis protein [Verrucomicrobiae bacterium]|nr:carotenoid biosynthesis protein [Verrucomicrobiae bacterium]
MAENHRSNPPNASVILIHRLFATLLAAVFALEIFNLLAPLSFSNWLESVLFVLAIVSTMTALTRTLPLQNVLLAAFVIALIGGGVSFAGARTGIPFGPVIYEIQPQIYEMPWALPLLWVLILLNSRGVARMILRPWRKIKTYGFWLMGITAALATLFEFALESFVHARHFWLWQDTHFAWQGAPPSNFFSWFAVTLLILAFVTPALINKQLSKSRAPDFYPLWIWIGAILVFTIESAVSKNWPAVGADAAIGIVTAVFAVRGARW